jgi:hypothetical protein
LASATPVLLAQNIYTYQLYVPARTLANLNSRIQIQVYANFTSGSKTLTMEFRGNTISHVHTTLVANVGTTGPPGTNGAGGATGYYGNFYSSTTYSLTSGAGGTVQFPNTFFSNGITTSGTDTITFAHAGTYLIQALLQLECTMGNNHTATLEFFVVKNDVIVPNSSYRYTFDTSGGASTKEQVAVNAFIQTVNAGDTIKFGYDAIFTNGSFRFLATAGGPSFPATPSTNLCITQVAYNGPTGATGATGLAGFTGPTGAVKLPGGVQNSIQFNDGVGGLTGTPFLLTLGDSIQMAGQAGSMSVGPTGISFTTAGQIKDNTGSTGSAYQVLSAGPTGAGVAWASPFGPHSKFVMVDQVYGNDTDAIASPVNTSFKTIRSALTYIGANAGFTVYVYPGTYYEAIAIPNNTALIGTSSQTTSITDTGPTGSSTLVTMGTNSRVENMTLNLSSNTGPGPYTGVLFPPGSAITSSVRNSVINLTGTYVGPTGPIMYGVLCTDTGTNTYSTFDALVSTSVNVSTTTTGPTGPFGVFHSGTSYLGIRDSDIVATGPTGPTGPIGVSTSNTGPLVSLKSSTIFGSLFDILQFPVLPTGTTGGVGTISLSNSDLLNDVAGPNSFIVNSESPRLHYTLVLPSGYGGNTTYNLLPGVLFTTTVPGGIMGISFPQRTCVYQASFSLSTNTSSGGVGTITANFSKSSSATTVGTIFMSGAIALAASPTTPASVIIRGSSTFRPLVDFLVVRTVSSALGGFATTNQVLTISLATY